MEPGTRIAGEKTVKDWLEVREQLLKPSPNPTAWSKAYDFLRMRIDTRYIKPISAILSMDTKRGEGYSATALLCVLVEFLEALFQGVIYRPPLSDNAIKRIASELGIAEEHLKRHSQPNEYASSSSLFVSFLTKHEPFLRVFTRAHADTFFRDIRCGLLHEAATKNESKIRAENAEDPARIMEPGANGIVIYRNAFRNALVAWIEAYKDKLLTDGNVQRNFLRKMDDIAQIRRCFYFAYGSNMHQSQLLSRIRPGHIDSARTARLPGFSFRYNKKSNDKTAKANISRSDGKTVWGVCYEIDEHDFRRLKSFEKGYDPTEVWTEDEEGRAIIAMTYMSNSITNTLPSNDYIQDVVKGARENSLPEDYIRECLEKH